MVRRYGWAPRGWRCRIPAPHGHTKTTTVTAALRASGPFAIDLMDGATNGVRFQADVTDGLVPALKPGDTVVLDNLGAHKVTGVRQAIEAAGARLFYLPPYNHDFNPIEMCLVPGFDGAISSPAWKNALWAKFFTGAPQRQRRSVERYSIVKRA